MMQVPIIAKADSMTVDELRQFRKYIRSELEQVRNMHFAFPVLARIEAIYNATFMCMMPLLTYLRP